MFEGGIGDGELVVRVLVAAALCGLIGLERESRERVAGLRTHILVGVGAALFTLVSAYGFEDFLSGQHAVTDVSIDPTRIAAQIVTGIGFLGAGTIIRAGVNVRGLTTAASLWVAAAVGMAAGAGYFLGAVVVTALVLISLLGLRKLRGQVRVIGRPELAAMTVEMDKKEGKLARVIDVLDSNKVNVDEVNIEVVAGTVSCVISVEVPAYELLQRVLDQVDSLPGITRASVSGMRRD